MSLGSVTCECFSIKDRERGEGFHSMVTWLETNAKENSFRSKTSCGCISGPLLSSGSELDARGRRNHETIAFSFAAVKLKLKLLTRLSLMSNRLRRELHGSLLWGFLLLAIDVACKDSR